MSGAGMVVALGGLLAAPSPSDGGEFNSVTVSPGLPGFLAAFVLAAAMVLLGIDMTRRTRRIQAQARVEERMEAEAAERAERESGVRAERESGVPAEQAAADPADQEPGASDDLGASDADRHGDMAADADVDAAVDADGPDAGPSDDSQAPEERR